MPYFPAVGHIDDTLSPQEVMREYRRRYGLAAYHRRRQALVAELGGQCSVCGARDCDLVMVRRPGSPRFHAGSLVTASKKRRDELIAHVTLMCEPHASEQGRGDIKHGAYWAAYRRKCQCDECGEYRANRALERREDRRRASGKQYEP